MTGRLQRLRRVWNFGRHIPPAKLVRRLRLVARRRLRDRLGPFLPPLPEARPVVGALPRPQFPPRRTGALRAEGEGLVFTFLGHDIAFADGRVDWLAPGTADQLWRMNLHYMEYLEDVDDTLFAHLIEEWIEQNGKYRPGAWRDSWNSYALSIRVVVWLQQLATRRNRLSTVLVERIEESVLRQVTFLARDLETDIGGNHLIKNIKALLWAGAYFEGPAPSRWQALGLRLLRREIAVQILPDGIHYERSPAYHVQVFADLLECCAVLPAALSSLDAALERMAQAAADLVHPDGLVAQFNDAGLHMAYVPGACLDVYAAQFGKRPIPRENFAYRDGGYFGYRNERTMLIADCGSIGPGDLPAHSHGDILSFELSIDGHRVIVDQGVYEYVPGPRRERSRASSAHNTVWIEGVDQAEFFDAFRCGRRPKVRLESWCATDDGIVLEGSHDGYAVAPGSPRHRRHFEAGSEGLMIRDRIEVAQDMCAKAGFLLHPEVAVVPVEEGGFLLCLKGGSAIRLESTVRMSKEAAVWWPDMGSERATTRLVAEISSANIGAETRFSFVSLP